jgi:hypothetical protein
MKYTTLFLLGLAALMLTLAGCTSFTEQFTGFVTEQVNGGNLTPEQGQNLIDLWKAKATTDADWWQIPLAIVTTIALNAIGIRSNLPLIGRGAPTQKVGLPASKVQAGA